MLVTDIESVMQRFESLRVVLSSMQAKTLLEVDVTMSQAQLMFLVHTRPDISMSTIAATLGVGSSAVSGLVDRLVEHGYLERMEDPSDRRQQLVSLTAAGRDVVEHMRELDETLMRRLLSGLSDKELKTVGNAIDVLVRQATLVAVDPDQAQDPTEGTPA